MRKTQLLSPAGVALFEPFTRLFPLEVPYVLVLTLYLLLWIQICQFCYNNIKTHSEQGRCPNCRRVYDDSSIQYRVPDVDE